jgi:branched-chain amino acid transport system permease protein
MTAGTRRLATGGMTIAFVILLALVPVVVPGRFWPHILSITMIYAMLALGQNIITGWCGLLTLGQASFLGMGAYTSALLTMRLGLAWPIAFLASGLVAGLAGALLAIPCLRVRNDFLSLVTIAFNQMFFVVADNWMDLTRGPMGLPSVPPMRIGSWTFHSQASKFWLILAVALVVYGAVQRLTSGPIGRAWSMIRDDETAARALGVNVVGYKVLAFAVGCFVCGLAGSLYAHYLRFVSPDMFGLTDSLLMMQMAILGGLASIPGSALGACLMVLLPEALRSSQPWLITLRPGLAGGILVLLMIWRPNGLLGTLPGAAGPFAELRRRALQVARMVPALASRSR